MSEEWRPNGSRAGGRSEDSRDPRTQPVTDLDAEDLDEGFDNEELHGEEPLDWLANRGEAAEPDDVDELQVVLLPVYDELISGPLPGSVAVAGLSCAGVKIRRMF